MGRSRAAERFNGALRHGSLGTELIAKLQQQLGRRQPPVWTISIDAELTEQLPAQWQSEETLRGDYARAVQRCAEGPKCSSEHQLAAESAERQLLGIDIDLVNNSNSQRPTISVL